jgi:hypothetical protein
MLGTPQLATDSSTAVAWRASYQPFRAASVSGTITQNIRLPGQYFDVESGWNHNGSVIIYPILDAMRNLTNAPREVVLQLTCTRQSRYRNI